MFIQELTIEIKSNTDKNELVEEFHNLLNTFRKSGQSQSNQEASFFSDSHIRCNIQTLEKDSLHKKYNTDWAAKQITKLEKLSSSKLQIKILGPTYKNSLGVCKCKEHDFLVLFTHWLNDGSPLYCGNCLKTIPLYRLVTLDQTLRQQIWAWEKTYVCCDTLQMGSTIGEKWATKQMTEYNSQLSKEGIALCSDIKKLTGLPTYYYLFNYRKIKVDEDKKRQCPSCGEPWLLDKQPNRFFDFKCDKCKLVSSVTTNSV